MNDIPPKNPGLPSGQPQFATIPGDGGKPSPGAPTPIRGPAMGLAENLERTGRHPVLIFGSSAAGKSTFLMSLIQSLRANEHVDVALGDPVHDRADPQCEAQHQKAREFFERSPYTIARRDTLAATQGEPFFLPLDITPRNQRLGPVRLAFLDSRGENYLPNQNPEEQFYRAFHDSIVEVLERFSNGLTVIYVAPYSISDGHDRDTLDSDFGLLGAIDSYRVHRHSRINDCHLFLMTKWDQYAPILDPQPTFTQVTGSGAAAVIEERYPHAWGDFRSLPLDGPAGYRRAFMQYSSGYFEKGRPGQPPLKFAKAFARYPRTVLNWLYGNARQFQVNDDDLALRVRPVLFDDVDNGNRASRSLIDRIVQLLSPR